jgi:hypothetical protein
MDGAIDAIDDDDVDTAISKDVSGGIDARTWTTLYNGFVKTEFNSKEKVVAAVRSPTPYRGNE